MPEWHIAKMAASFMALAENSMKRSLCIKKNDPFIKAMQVTVCAEGNIGIKTCFWTPCLIVEDLHVCSEH